MLKLFKKFLAWLRELYSYKAMRLSPPPTVETKRKNGYYAEKMAPLPKQKRSKPKIKLKIINGRHK